ncbi:MAG: DegT/DnrJ/EryC1/StrS family aminotransferase [Planctomycetota bacterium]
MHPQFRGRRVHGTFSGRAAIALACDVLALAPGDEILVPSYTCGTELDALLRQGLVLRGYSVDRSCRFDLEEIKSRAGGRTKAVYVVHYFGWSQDLGPLRRWTQERGLRLIEDCALALFSEGVSGPLGTIGDAAIFSMPKTLGTAHGGLLSLAAELESSVPSLRCAGATLLARELIRSSKALAWRGIEFAGLVSAIRSRQGSRAGGSPDVGAPIGRPDMPSDYYFTDDHWRTASRPEIGRVLASIDAVEVVRRRRRNFSALRELIGSDGRFEPLLDSLPSGVCPLHFPIVTERRDELHRRLWRKGIAAIPWWSGFHRNALDWSAFPEAEWLKQRVLCLPVHQGLGEREMEWIADSLRRAEPGSGTP